MPKRSKSTRKQMRAGAMVPAPPADPSATVPLLRQGFTSSAIAAIVSGLIGLASFCAVPLFNANKAMREVQDGFAQAVEDDREQINAAKQFTGRTDDMIRRDNASAVAYFGGHAWFRPHYYASAALRRDALATAALSLERVDTDLGSISAYAGQLKLIPAAYHTAAEEDLRANAAVWNALTALAETSTPQEEQKAFDVMVNRWAELRQASASFESSRLVLVSSLQRKQIDEQRAMEKEKADFHSLLGEAFWEVVGLGISVSGLLAILGFVLWPKAKPGT